MRSVSTRMTDVNPNRITAGKSGAGRFDFKRNTEAEIDLVDDVVFEVTVGPKPRLNALGLTMLRIAAENHEEAGEPVPAELAESIWQAEERAAQYEAWEQAQSAPKGVRAERVPLAKPEATHDLSTDEGRFAAAKAEEAKMQELLEASNAATQAVTKIDFRIKDLRRESYKGISFDVERLQAQAQPLRDAAREAHEAYIKQSKVWNDARDFAHDNQSAEGLALIEKRKEARAATFEAKARLSILINNRASEEEKEAARVEWRAAATAERALSERSK